jgi:glycosyltransferase involved in cell wall biosynthesis
MRIGFLVFSDFPDGAALGRRAYLLTKGLARAGQEIDVVVGQRYSDGPLEAVLDNNLRIFWATRTTNEKFHNLSERLRSRWRTLTAVKHLTARGLDWLVIVYPELDRLPHLLTARLGGARIAVTYEDERALPPYPTLKDRYYLLRGSVADKIIPHACHLAFPTSSRLENRLRDTAPDTPCCLLTAVVDPETFVPDDAGAAAFRAKWQLLNNPIISYLGTYWHVEGLANLLRAAAELKSEGERFQLVISGKEHAGFRCDNVAKISAELGIQDIVVETGWLSTREVIAAMSAADILAVPKIDHVSNVAGFPAKLAEYLSIGRSVAVSDVGDISKYVKDGEDALLCQPGSIRSLKKSLALLLHDKSLRCRLAANARRAALLHFDYDAVARKALQAMEALSAKAGESHRREG